MTENEIPEDLIRDLVQCVQAARDGAADDSLFAIQCDLVLARANREIRGILKPRSIQPSLPFEMALSGGLGLHADYES